MKIGSRSCLPVWTALFVVVVLILLLLPSLSNQQEDAFSCMTMLPKGRYLTESQTSVSPCPVAIYIGENLGAMVKYTPGVPLRGQFRVGENSLTGMLCRASQVALSTPLGVWNATSPFQTPSKCLKRNDALYLANSLISSGTTLAAFWIPPATSGNGDVEFVCTVVDDRNKFWICNSMMISELPA